MKFDIKQWHILHLPTKKYHVLYIAMDETTNFTSHMSHEPWLFVWE
jgi:hypothetical protein